MRATSGALISLILASAFSGALAQSVESDGWTSDAAGFAHAESQTHCPADSDGFKPATLTRFVEPNILGTCLYEDAMGTGDAGVRVRRYMAGVGESEEAIRNDRMLMEPDPAHGAPLFTVRIVPLTFVDGKRGGRLTITKVRGGLLIDCYAEDADFGNATAKVAALCGK